MQAARKYEDRRFEVTETRTDTVGVDAANVDLKG
jgi:hypothetical protein